MKRFAETEYEKDMWMRMSTCLLDAQIANRPLFGTPEFERNVLAAAGELIASSPSDERPDLMLAFWQCLTTDLRPGKEAA